MLGARRVRRIALTGAVIALTGALVPTAPAAGQAVPSPETTPLAETKPVDTSTIDPVLDAVEVDTTPAIRRADDDLERSVAAQNQAALRWIEAERRRAEMQARAGTATQRAAAAQATLVRRLGAEAEALQALQARQQRERLRRAALAAEQDVLRTMAAGLFARLPDDAYAVLGSLGDVNRAVRRETLQDRGVALQSERVERTKAPWLAARSARRAQERVLAAATRSREAAAAEAQRTADERDRFGQLLDALGGKAAAAAGRLTASQRDSRAVLVERRRARLGSSVTGLDLPLVALDAYWRASALAPCAVPWWVIAGVGRAESRHGTGYGGSVTPEGDTTVHILGIALDGRPGTQAVGDTDGGRLDGDTTWDRAVGPMQFIPGTWGRWAADGNADQKADPHNIYDAAGAAAAYLCYRRGDLDTEAKQRQALLAYNRSIPYGTSVLTSGRRYRDALELPEVAPRSAEGQ